MSAKGRGVAIVLAAAFFISVANVLAPIIYAGGSNALTYLTLRFLCFVVFCRLWFWIRSKSPALSPRLRLIANGVGVAFAVGAGALLSAFAYMPVSMVVLIFYLYPLLTMIAACVLDRRRPTAIEIMCLVVAFMGLSLALEVSFASLDPTGFGLSILSAFGIATAFVWSGRSLQDLDNSISTFHMAVGALVVAGLVTLATGSFTLEISSTLGWLALAVAMLSFTTAFFAVFQGVRMIGPVRLAMFMNMEPVFTIALSLMFLGESLTLQQYAGAALVIGAVTVAQRPVREAD